MGFEDEAETDRAGAEPTGQGAYRRLTGHLPRFAALPNLQRAFVFNLKPVTAISLARR